jgi:hypothetical protein
MAFRDTTSRDHAVARALDRLGHGRCGGYFDSPRGISCACGAPLTMQVEKALERMRQPA